MPYDRDEVIAEVTAYYEFLTRLHVKPEDIRRPPPEGWPEITSETLAPLKKTDEVIDLLKHLPYVQNDDNFTPIIVWAESGCADYTGRECHVQLSRGFAGCYEPDEDDGRDNEWEKVRKPFPQMVALFSKAGKYGDYIMIDTADGEMGIWSYWEPGEERVFPSAKECFAYFKKKFLEVREFPISRQNIKELWASKDENETIKRLAKEHGWPLEEFNWREFTAALRAEKPDMAWQMEDDEYNSDEDEEETEE